MVAYGALWPGTSSPTLTRLGSAFGMTAGANFSAVQPWGGMRRVNLLDNGIITATQNAAGTGCGYDDSQTGVAAKGQAMSLVPAFLIYVDTTGHSATTTSSGTTNSGQAVINVASTANFSASPNYNVVCITDGTNTDYSAIGSIGTGPASLTLATNLNNSYAAGSTVTQYTTAWWIAPVGSTDTINNQDGATTHTFSPSDLHPAFIRNGLTKPYILLGAYEGYNNSGKLESWAGATPTASMAMATARGYAQARNPSGTPTGANWVSGWSIEDWLAMSAVQDLFIVEAATLNSQSYLNGCTKNAVITTGTTTSYGNTSYGGDATTGMSYRGIENIWNNYWCMIDGINFSNNVAWVADHGFACDTFAAPYVTTGVTLSTVQNYNICTVNTKGPFNFGFLPTSSHYTAGTNYFSDAFVGTASATPGNTVLGRYGGATVSASNGLFFMGINIASSSTSASDVARLMYIPL